jgi:hypothetical protein
VAIGIGYLNALGGNQVITVAGMTPTNASDNIFVGGAVEGPMLWGAVCPIGVFKWLLSSRYQPVFDSYIATRGFFAGAGLGGAVNAWEATLRFVVAGGYWWEDVTVDFTGFRGLNMFELNNDKPALQLGTSFSFPFSGRVNAQVGAELVLRSADEFSGSFVNGRRYELETYGTYGTVSIGLVVALEEP